MPRNKKKQVQPAGNLDALGGSPVVPTISPYENWRTGATPGTTWKLDQILKEAGRTDPAERQQILDLLLSEESYKMGKRGPAAISTYLSKNQSQNPKDRHTQSNLYQKIAAGDIQGIKDIIGFGGKTPLGGEFGNTKLPSNVPAPVEKAIDIFADIGSGGLKGLMAIPGMTADIAKGVMNFLGTGLSGLLGGSGQGGGQGDGKGSGGPDNEMRLFRPEQEEVMNQLMNMGLKELQGNQYNFAPIRQEAYRQFEQQGLPSLAQRFTNLGGRRGSGGFGRYATQARGDLESQLAALESQYQQGRYGQLQNLTNLGLGRRFEPKIIEKQPTGMQQFVQHGLGPLIETGLPLAAKAIFGI